MSKYQNKLHRLVSRIRRLSKLSLLTGLFSIILIVSTIALWQVKKSDSGNKHIAVPTDMCAQNNTLSFTCYKDELTAIVNKNNPQSAFALLKEQYPKVDYVKSQCHQLVHIIGRAAYAKYGNIGDTFTNGDQFCWAGYYHGMMEQVADEQGTEKFLSSIGDICEEIAVKERYSFNHYNCVHGIGHGVMEALEGKLFDALAACEAISNGYNRTSCYGGVFMQNIMIAQSPDETVDHSSAYLKNDEPMYPCTAVNEAYKQQCYLMQTSHALQVEGYDFKKVFGLCDATPSPHRDTCYQSLGRDASGQSISDVEQTKDKCLLGKDFNAQSNCIIGAAKDFVSYFHSDTKAKQLCASLTSSLVTVCSETVRNYYSSF